MNATANDIRRALADIDGVRSLSFQLSARTLSIDAPDSVLPAAVAAKLAAQAESVTKRHPREARAWRWLGFYRGLAGDAAGAEALRVRLERVLHR